MSSALDITEFTSLRGPVLSVWPSDGKPHFSPDALLVIQKEHISEFYTDATQATHELQNRAKRVASDALILPGMIDLHTHVSQLFGVGAHAGELLPWLEKTIFPLEEAWLSLSRPVMEQRCRAFLDRLISEGTTCAAVFGFPFPNVQEVFLNVAKQHPMHVISGVCLMDRNAPESLLPVRETEEWEEIISRHVELFHQKNNLTYSLCPRFAPSCSSSLLRLAGNSLQKHPDVWLQTHLSENQDEVKWVQQLFPQHASYTHVYDDHGCLTERSLLAHAIHLDEREHALIQSRRAHTVHCPSANAFLGSGLYPFHTPTSRHILGGLGTDIGAGTSFSVLKNAGDAYRVAQLQRTPLSVEDLFLLTSWTPAVRLKRPDLGHLTPGASAHFVVLSPPSDPVLQETWTQRSTWQERFFLASVSELSFVQEVSIGGTSLSLQEA